LMSEQAVIVQAAGERECVHRSRNAAGGFYRGDVYVESLQRLRSADAMKMAGKVSPFFWSDAPHLRVWLCHECAGELGLQGR
jgi:hypothetical protein